MLRNANLMILKAGSTHPELAKKHGDFEAWILRHLALRSCTPSLLHPETDNDFPAVEQVGGLIITGSHSMLTETGTLDWVGRTSEWIRQLVSRDVPVLGVCFGHQLLVQAFGGRVDFLAGGPEYGTATIRLRPEAYGDPLLRTLPERFPAYVAHSQSAIELPRDAVLLASSPRDPHQVFRLGSAWGVQFHPEFTAEITRFYISRLDGRQPGVASPPIDPQAEQSSVVLRNFGEMVEGGILPAR